MNRNASLFRFRRMPSPSPNVVNYEVIDAVHGVSLGMVQHWRDQPENGWQGMAKVYGEHRWVVTSGCPTRQAAAKVVWDESNANLI